MLLQVLLLIVGFALLIKGADWFVDGASIIATKLRIPQLIIGMTVVAMGTSLPEAAISISAAIKQNAGIALGNVLGSNSLNVLLILGLTAVIAPITVQSSTAKVDIPFLLIVSVAVVLLGLLDHMLSRIDGIILLVLFVIYLAYLFYMARKHPAEDTKPAASSQKQQKKFWLSIVLTAVGIAMIVFGSNLAVDAATYIAQALGISDRVIGLTIVALGTSLPELVTSVTAAIKKNTDIAIGNVVGSNLFNILFVLAASAVISPIAYPPAFLVDSLVCIASSGILLLLLAFDHKLQRSNGIIMLICFAAYYVYLFLPQAG